VLTIYYIPECTSVLGTEIQPFKLQPDLTRYQS